MLELVEAFQKVRWLLEHEDKWCKFSFFQDGKRCLVGACDNNSSLKSQMVMHLMDTLGLSYQARASELLIYGQVDISSLVKWNDALETKHSDVIKAIDDTIARLKNALNRS